MPLYKSLKSEIFLILSSIMFLQSCAMTAFTNPSLDLAVFDIKTVESNKEAHFEVAQRFILHCQQQELNDMLELTSSYTLENETKDAVSDIYQNKVIPAFVHSIVSWNPEGEVVTSQIGDKKYVVGLDFYGKINQGGNESEFRISVFKENGEYKVASIGRP